MDEFIVQLITRLDTSNAITDLDKLKGQLESKNINLKTVLNTSANKQELQNFAKQIQSALNQASSGKLNIDTSNILSSLNQVIKDINSTTSKANKIQLSMETGGYESKVETLIAKTRQWTDSEGQARINTTALSNALAKLTQASEAYANNKSEATQKRLIESSKKLDNEYQKITNDVRKMNAEMAKDSAISSLHNQVNDFMSKNGKAVKYSGEFMRIFSETAQGAKLTREEIAKLNQEFNNAVVQARNAGKLGKTFFQTLREGMRSFSYWTSSTFLVMKAIQSIKGGLGTVKALDTALVDLKKTTTMTNSELEDFYYSSNKVAKQMGVTTEEIINQASEFSRLGYSSKEAATQMAKYSSWFKTISPGMSIEQAGDTLTSVMKSFKYDVQDVEKIMSMINTVGNNFAVSNLDISEILTRSSSAMMEANNSLADTIALGTAATEITRDAASVGNALKTISMRIRGKQTLPPYKEIYMLCA